MRFIHRLLGGKTEAPLVAARGLSPRSDASVPAPTRLAVGWATDVGAVRSHNEDTVLVVTAACDGDGSVPEVGLFVLADGMGGHRSGEIASALAARVVADHILRQFYLPTLVDYEQSTGQQPLNDVLVDAVHAANNAVTSQVPGGGTTLTCAVMLGPRAYVAHVGDSRAYVATQEALEQVTHDHSVVDRLIELGQLTPAEAASHPQKNVLYRALGQSGTLEVETYVRTIPSDACLLLCSDGLWGMVDEAEIVRLTANASSLQEVCASLVVAANRAGGHDNISVVLAKPPASPGMVE